MVILLAGAFLRDNSSSFLSNVTGMSAPGVFRVLGGFWEAVLCLLIIWLLWGRGKNIVILLAITGCAVGTMNGIMNSVGRIMLPPPPYPEHANIFDLVVGFQIGYWILGAQLAVVFIFIGTWLGNAKSS